MKFRDLVEEVKTEIAEDKKADAKAIIKERLLEIEETEAVLSEMKAQLEDMLDDDIG